MSNLWRSVSQVQGCSMSGDCAIESVCTVMILAVNERSDNRKQIVRK